jgi:hypothetical protein
MLNSTLSLRAEPPKDGRKSSLTILIAFHAAGSFYESGMREYAQLQRVHTEDSSGVVRATFHDFLTHGIPAGHDLVFALEVYLKVLYAQRNGTYPHSHEVLTIYDQLAAEVRARLDIRFRDFLKADVSKPITEFSLQLHKKPEGQRHQFKVNCVDDSPSSPDEPELLRHEMAACNTLYKRWRYLYETGLAVDGITVRFASLINMCRAIASEIETYDGGVIISGEAD